MTFVKTLKQAEKNGKTITATENIGKFSNVPYYHIIISRDGIAEQIIQTAKTTWEKKFDKIVKG